MHQQLDDSHVAVQLCIQNNNRPAAAALADIVAAALAAYQAAYTSDQLRLELEHGVHCGVDAAGYRLTAGEQWYRTQWLDTASSMQRSECHWQRQLAHARYQWTAQHTQDDLRLTTMVLCAAWPVSLIDDVCACRAQVYMTMQVLAGLRNGDAALGAARALRPWRPEDQGLLSTVERTVQVVLQASHLQAPALSARTPAASVVQTDGSIQRPCSIYLIWF